MKDTSREARSPKAKAHNRPTARAATSSNRLRRTLSDEESLLWSHLRTFRASGYAFRRQAPIVPYIADFLCRRAMLVVEVDGRHHDDPAQMARDDARTAWLEAKGYRVVRYAAGDIWRDPDGIASGLEARLAEAA